MESLFDFKKKSEADKQLKPEYNLSSISNKDIAVIGMSGRFGAADCIETFWKDLKVGKDYITDLPQERKKDCGKYIESLTRAGAREEDFKYYRAGFMDRIDHFDCAMFNISPKEANLMDPSQRIMLEVIFEAIEDAGYGGKKLSGSRTGVYIGHSNDFGEDYKRYCRMLSDFAEEAAATGNIRSIIGSRIAYILDLKGPSITVDTACSSALIAIHTACQAIRSGDCTMAIAGGVKIHLIPTSYRSMEGNIGILSSIEKARTFDESSDGTGLGEGAGAVILKPLSKAVEDGDSVYAVIKGSAANQDGSSVGITAPNMDAQTDVILRAWKDAGIDPETIGYIETHGTGTKLGDPIEVAGIQKAFECYTDKKQFCAVASVKTNVGHLDNASGIVSFVKAVLATKTGELPPTLNFQTPNRKIDFESSPVYVNDQLRKWGSNGIPRRCGVSAFGLSGTNCHVVLEEYRPGEHLTAYKRNNGMPCLFTLSAKSEASYRKLAEKYKKLFENQEEMDLANMCYTSNTGRGHYNIRTAIIAENFEELKKYIGLLGENNASNLIEGKIYQGMHKIVPASKPERAAGDITEIEKAEMENEAKDIIERIKYNTDMSEYRKMLGRLCSLYIKGTDIGWERVYQSQKHAKVRLPIYPFSKERHWVEAKEIRKVQSEGIDGYIGHPILDACKVQSMEMDIYTTNFTVEKHWVLNEHKIVGIYAVPGTAYIEMIREIAGRYYPKDNIVIKDILFVTPLIVNEGSEVELQIAVKEKDGSREFAAVSKSGIDGGWVKHVEGTFSGLDVEEIPRLDLKMLKTKLTDIGDLLNYKNPGRGPRFNSMRHIRMGHNELLGYIELETKYSNDMEAFKMHPALLDCAIIMIKEFIGGAFYLPLSYQGVEIYGNMPDKFYVYMARKGKEGVLGETESFSLSLADVNGCVFAVIRDYAVKRVNSADYNAMGAGIDTAGFFEIGWVEKPLQSKAVELYDKTVLIMGTANDLKERIISDLQYKGANVLAAATGNDTKPMGGGRYIVANSENGYRELLSLIAVKPAYIVFLQSPKSIDHIETEEDLEKLINEGVFGVYYLVRALLGAGVGSTKLMLVSDYADSITGEERMINPHNTAFLGIGKVIEKEYPGILCQCIDIDSQTSAANIIDEMGHEEKFNYLAYRNGRRYAPEFRKIAVTEEKAIIEIKSEGAYLITGGTGGIGLEFARYLSRRNPVKLCLVNRTAFPKRSEWGRILEQRSDERLCKKINMINAIEASGSSVMFYSADISDSESMKTIIDEIKEKHGKVNGVIHGAGVAGNGFIIKRKENEFREVITPKTIGTWLVDKLTAEDKPDFFVLLSSVASVIAPAGQGDYSAANSFLDAYAHYMNKQGRRALAINWPSWKETGMAVDHDAVNENSIFEPLSTASALDMFERLLNTKTIRAIPTKLNYNRLQAVENELPVIISESIRHTLNRINPASIRKIPEAGKSLNEVKVVLKGKIEQGYTETENKLGKMWAVVLGINEVDIYDSFNDVGGDSILSTTLLKEIKKEYGDLVGIADVFTYPTIYKMADYIDKKNAGKKDIDNSYGDIQNDTDLDLDNLLKQIANGDISVEKAGKILKVEMDEPWNI